MTYVDVVIRGGQVFTGGELVDVPLGIVNGLVVQIGGELTGERTLDARGKLVLPGGIDPHVHLSMPPDETSEPRWVDDFTSGSAAALAGGITTLGNMSFLMRSETLLAGLEREASVARQQTIADLFLHPVVANTSPAILEEIARLLDTGCNSIKIFMSAPSFDAQITGYLEAIRRAGASGLVTMMHCEDYPIIDAATTQAAKAGGGTFRLYGESRPVLAEVVATQRAVALAEASGSPVYIVHLSSARALEVCTEARSRGVPVYVETRPLYLHLTGERFLEADAAKYVGQPPLRTQADVDALWSGLANGTIHTVATDHAPWSLAAKLEPGHTLTALRPGVADLDTMLPMLYSQGVLTGRLTLQRFIEVISTNTAKLFGLYPRKGTIAVGSDADLIVFDPALSRTISGAMLQSNADYSVYDGWQVTGWPVITLRRGEVVFQDDRVVGQPGSGLIVRRGPTQHP